MFFDSPVPLAAVVAFAALGANLLGTGLLLLLNPRSRAVRWHAAFTFWVIAWLALQGWFALGLGNAALARVYGWVVHMIPAFFLAAALIDTYGVRNGTAFLVVAAAALTADVLNPLRTEVAGTLWQALLWGTAALVHFRGRSRRPPRAAGSGTGERALVITLLVVVPISVVGVIVLGGRFLLYAMPLITLVIQFLIFIGVVHHRFYDIEVRAARSGELAAAAAEQERLALVGELSATLAHEIRNPLTGIRSLTQRLAQGSVDAARRERYAEVILGEIGRLERIVSNLLDASKQRVGRDDVAPQTELGTLFDDVVLLVEGRARRGQVTLDRRGVDLAAAAPRDALAQALLNLLLNAVAHTPAGGRVTLEADAAGAWIDIRVTDTGPGVPMEERERIFEPFHTRGGGTGLGLTVVRRLARDLGWRVSVEQAAEGGACFVMRVPAYSPEGSGPGDGHSRTRTGDVTHATGLK